MKLPLGGAFGAIALGGAGLAISNSLFNGTVEVVADMMVGVTRFPC